MPKSIATAKDGSVILACNNDVVIVKDNKIASALHVNYQPSSVSISPDGTEVAVGGSGVS